MIPSLDSASLRVQDVAASATTLHFMLVVMAVLLPIILTYTIYSYWIFRGKRDLAIPSRMLKFVALLMQRSVHAGWPTRGTTIMSPGATWESRNLFPSCCPVKSYHAFLIAVDSDGIGDLAKCL